VSAATLAEIESGATVEDPDDAALVDFTRELCGTGKVGDEAFERARDRLGEEGTVELAAIIGYYTMLAVFMNACEAC
jgi:4-carboxymuconolactone decarboxylase